MKAQARHRMVDVITLTAPDWHQHNRNSFWYVGVGLLVLVGSYLAFAARDYIAMTLAVVVGIALFRAAHLKPSSRTIRLSSRGVDWGGQFFNYHQFRAFWIAEVDGRVVVYLERLNLAPTISFLINPNQIKPVSELLATHLPWHSHKREPLGERFGRMLRI